MVGTSQKFLSWIYDPKGDEEVDMLAKNIRFWLTGQEDLYQNEMINITEAITRNYQFDQFKLIVWPFNYEINDKYAGDLLRFVEKGG